MNKADQKLKNKGQDLLGLNLKPKQIYFKKTQDFIADNKPQFYEKELDLSEIELQCEGYSLMQKPLKPQHKPKQVLRNFFVFFHRLCTHIKEKKHTLKTLKITLNGFKLDRSQENQILRLAANIKSIGKNLQLLWIHTSDLSDVTLEDFGSLFKLIRGFAQQGSAIHYEQFSLQCANWNFEKAQPSFKDFRDKLRQVFAHDSAEHIQSDLKQKRIRLEFSGWWYSAAQAKFFLGFLPCIDDLKMIDKIKRKHYQSGTQFVKQQFSNQAKKFNDQMFELISNMINTLDEVENIEVDMRNNHGLLQLSRLKQKIASQAISEKKNVSQKSLISMQKVTILDEVKHLRVYFTY